MPMKDKMNRYYHKCHKHKIVRIQRRVTNRQSWKKYVNQITDSETVQYAIYHNI